MKPAFGRDDKPAASQSSGSHYVGDDGVLHPGSAPGQQQTWCHWLRSFFQPPPAEASLIAKPAEDAGRPAGAAEQEMRAKRLQRFEGSA